MLPTRRPLFRLDRLFVRALQLDPHGGGRDGGQAPVGVPAVPGGTPEQAFCTAYAPLIVLLMQKLLGRDFLGVKE